MTTYGSVSQLIAQAKDGDEVALTGLHRRYWPKLVELARRRLHNVPPSTFDEEDIAQEAFIGFFRSMKNGRTLKLENRHQFLAFLTHIIACKAVNEINRNLAQKRGAGKVVSVSPLLVLAQDESHSPLESVILEDCYQYYIALLPKSLKPIAELHLAGLTNIEIAIRLDCVERTVVRKLALMREEWEAAANENMNENIDSIFE